MTDRQPLPKALDTIDTVVAIAVLSYQNNESGNARSRIEMYREDWNDEAIRSALAEHAAWSIEDALASLGLDQNPVMDDTLGAIHERVYAFIEDDIQQTGLLTVEITYEVSFGSDVRYAGALEVDVSQGTDAICDAIVADMEERTRADRNEDWIASMSEDGEITCIQFWECDTSGTRRNFRIREYPHG